MALDSMAIALHGLGYGHLQLAMRGLLEPPPVPQALPAARRGHGLPTSKRLNVSTARRLPAPARKR
jgi:hypothetical protein